MAQNSLTPNSLTQRNSQEWVRPGPLGRAIRAGLGLATLSLFLDLLTGWRAGLWGGAVPVRDVGFWVLVGLALWGTSYVFNIALGLSWGQRTRTGVVAGAALAGLIGAIAGAGFPNAVFGVYLWVWFAAFTGLLGSAFLLAAALGTPGCEMRSFVHAFALLRGGDVSTVVCPGGIDRLDHIGRTPLEEVAG